MRRLALFFAWLAFIWTAAAALAGDDSHVSFVPWKVVEAGETVDAPLVLYWIPSTAEELRRSRLITSDELMLFSARCVAMRIVRVDDEERLIALRSDVELPRAVLVDA